MDMHLVHQGRQLNTCPEATTKLRKKRSGCSECKLCLIYQIKYTRQLWQTFPYLDGTQTCMKAQKKRIAVRTHDIGWFCAYKLRTQHFRPSTCRWKLID